MGLRHVIGFTLALLAATPPAFAQPGLGPGTGEYRSQMMSQRGTRVGEYNALDILSGLKATKSGSTMKLSSTSVISARDYLKCDGVTDDRAAFQSLVEVGGGAPGYGACVGKTCIFDADCTMLWSPCTSGSGDCTVATIAPGTRLIAEPGTKETVKLAARVCVGGLTPGAACPNGSGDCNTGTCSYDVGSLAFAHTTAATYTLFAGPSNAACTGFGTPWACCIASATGVCNTIPQKITIDGFRIAARQIENYLRCTNGGAEQGKACKGYCVVNSAWLGLQCDQTGGTDCIFGGTCLDYALCPGSGAVASECDSAALSPSGDGALNVIDMAATAGVTVKNISIFDQKKGKAVRVGPGSAVEDNQLVASQTTLPQLPLTAGANFPLASAVTNSVEAGNGSSIRRNRAIATGTVINVSAASGRIAETGGTNGPATVEDNFVWNTTAAGVGINVDAPNATVESNTVVTSGTGTVGIQVNGVSDKVNTNTVSVTGDYVWAIRGLAGSDWSTFNGNTMFLGASGNKEGVGMELQGGFSVAAGNVVESAQLTSSVAYRSNTVACNDWPECAEGVKVEFSGNTYNMVGSGNGVELFGEYSSWTGGNGKLASGSGQHFSFGQDQQHSVVGGMYQSGAVGAGATTKTFCDGGANDGRICSSGGDCTGGTCDTADDILNWGLNGVHFWGLSTVGVYCTTGCTVTGGRMTWFNAIGACGVMIGDDRVAETTNHTTIGGGLHLHSATTGFRGICYADVGAGAATMAGVVINGVLCLNGDACLDLNTSFDSNSPDVTNLTFDGNTCMSNLTSCVKFPTTGNSKVTRVVIGDNASAATNYVENWIPSMGSRPVSATFSASASAFGTGATCYLGNGNVTTSCPGASDISEWTVPANGVMGRMRCTLSTAPGNSNSRAFQLQADGSNLTSHTCTISGASSTACVQEGISSAVTAGQRLRIVMTRTSAVASSGSCTVDFYANP